MQYKQILQAIAKEYNTTSAEVDKEIRKAIKLAGYDISPAEFLDFAKTTLFKENE